MTSVPIRMPKFSMDVRDGTFIEWLVPNGDSVAEGQPIYLMETEKIETEVEAAVAGVLRQSALPGETYLVGAELGTIEVG